MNWLGILINFLLTIHVIVSILIVFLVLMQRPKNEGLGAAFGGGMTDNLFGAQTTNVLQTITRWLGGIFFALTLALSWLYVHHTGHKSSIQQKLSAPTVIPAATPPPATPEPAVTLEPKPTTPEAASPAMKLEVDPEAATKIVPTPAPEKPAAPPVAPETPADKPAPPQP